MEVHPPEHPIFTWKQFFVHMATVCLGLLIALGLEQGVEAMHRHEQARELREALQRETRQILDDQIVAVQNLNAVVAWGSMRRQQLYDGLWNNKPVPPTQVLSKPNDQAAAPSDPIFSAALANGRVALLTPEEVTVYQDIHSQIAEWRAREEQTVNCASAMVSFERSLPQRADSGTTTSVDYTRVSVEDRRKDLELYNNWLRNYLANSHYIEQLVGTEREIAKGERNLDRIHAVKNKTWKSWVEENAIHTAHR